MRLLSIDLETTGKNRDFCEILEFGAVLDDLENPLPLDSLPRYHTYIHNSNKITGQPYALSMHPIILRRIAEKEPGYKYTSVNRLGPNFKKFLLDNGFVEERGLLEIVVAGKNFAAFDLQFLEKTEFPKYVRIKSRIIDPAIFYMQIADKEPPGMEECLKRAGLPNDVKHNSISDALDVIKLIRIHYGISIG